MNANIAQARIHLIYLLQALDCENQRLCEEFFFLLSSGLTILHITNPEI
jgi:hypothetical protein